MECLHSSERIYCLPIDFNVPFENIFLYLVSFFGPNFCTHMVLKSLPFNVRSGHLFCANQIAECCEISWKVEDPSEMTLKLKCKNFLISVVRLEKQDSLNRP